MQVPEEWKPIVNLQKQWMLLRDPPNHTRLRSLVNTAFTPKVVARLRPHIEDIGTVEWRESTVFRGPVRLPVKV
jgi:pimeloyl-[acyl-carrier protein] synthase